MPVLDKRCTLGDNDNRQGDQQAGMCEPSPPTMRGNVPSSSTLRRGETTMGYYAHLLKGDPFTIYEPTKVLDFLVTYFPKTAWKDMVETARQEAGATDTQVLLDLLLTFGFSAEFDQYNLRVFSFDGKWMTFVTNLWDAFPLGMRNFETAWIMRGEDNEMWAEVITSDGHRGANVSVSYTVEV